jgi:hypothetical protein
MTATNEVEVKKSTKFQSPLPFLIQLRNLIFGKQKPDIFTRLTFYINLWIWLTFTVWSIISYISISARDFILQQKGISVANIIEERGVELGFEGDEFLNRLLTFHSISFICWMLVFVGLVLLYRKKVQFIYFVLGATIFYIGMHIFYLSFAYFVEDTTLYDKISLLIIVTGSLIHLYLLKNEKAGGSINFFGEIEEDTTEDEATA